MKATADSRMVKIKGAVREGRLSKKGILSKEFPNRDIRRCPAIKLAVNRTHKVMGRIKFLTNSIITINIIRGGGVPWGSRWDSICLMFF